MKPTLIGEHNPYGPDPQYALYPAPDGCSGERLCRLILGMRVRDYLQSFDRVDLCSFRWSMKEAKARAKELWEKPGRFVLLGSKVTKAFGLSFVPFGISEGGTILVLPHPSGLCRLWHDPDSIPRARVAMATFAPELAPLLGMSDSLT